MKQTPGEEMKVGRHLLEELILYILLYALGQLQLQVLTTTQQKQDLK